MVFKIRINTTFFENILIFVLVYFLSSILLSYYTQGDQIHYNKFYDYVQLNIATESIHKLYESMYSFIRAKEPVYFAVVYLAVCLGLSKIFVMSVANGLLAIFTYTYLQCKGWYKIYSFLIVTLSYYFIVLYTGAERLKFGFLFGILSLLLYNRAKIKLSYLCVLLSVLSHFSMVLLYVAIFIYMYDFKKNISKQIQKCIIITFILVLLFFVFKDIICSKLASYINTVNVSDLIKSVIVSLLAIFFSNGTRKLNIWLVFLFFILAVFVLGNRVFMFEVFFLVYFMLARNNSVLSKNNLVFLILLGILLVKGVLFIYNIFFFGSGFI
ncbi:hypothetical protein FN3523_1488 [Francisella hispaniensis]|uniref:EpsG family protein n=1 Tax=Francisella hispaniensis TaxID=622488 RepID=F4BH47_9GAMM|nr:hypothetical protein FN3523_1488 [Francisella hispaniensis]